MDLLLYKSWALPLLVALPFLGAMITPLAARLPLLDRRPWLVAIATTAICGAGFVALWLTPEEARFTLPWVSILWLDFSLRLDPLAFLFALLITGIGLAILTFSTHYLPHDLRSHGSSRRPSTFYAYVLFFMGSMLGVVCADELITLYLFWEATSVSSFLLIGLHLHEERSQAAAIQAFTITAAAGLLLFTAFLLIVSVVGTSTISELGGGSTVLMESRVTMLVIAGVILGAAAKSAQVPLHIWLPNAMVAPTPVSAYLHSATMVAAGVFLLARMAPLLAPIPGFSGTLIALGTLTMLSAGLVATTRNRLKEILAWSTISQYGYVTLLLGLEAWGAALFLIANHAVIKAGLFLCAGVVTHTTGETDVRRLGGLWRSLPLTTGAAGVLALGLAGVPATSGFWMKELLYKEVSRDQLLWLEFAALAAGILTFVYMLRFFWRTFGGTPKAAQRELEQERKLLPLLVPIVTCAAVVLLVGLLPGASLVLTDPAATSAAAGPVRTVAEIPWPPDRALELSAATFVLGPALFAWIERRARQQQAIFEPRHSTRAVSPGHLLAAVLRQVGPRRFWEWGLPSTDAASRFFARVQTGKLVHYLLFLAAVPAVLAVVLLPQVVDWPELVSPEQLDQASLAFAAVALAAVGLAIAAALVHSHIAAVLMVGGVGFLLALIFSLLRAPDVALVQVAVETVTALLLLIVLSRIRVTVREEAMHSRVQRPRAARAAAVVVAASMGALVTLTLLALQPNLAGGGLGRSFFGAAEELGIEAVVTAILVDFRGLDTFGEITVFAAAALGAVLLLERTTGGRRKEKTDG